MTHVDSWRCFMNERGEKKQKIPQEQAHEMHLLAPLFVLQWIFDQPIWTVHPKSVNIPLTFQRTFKLLWPPSRSASSLALSGSWMVFLVLPCTLHTIQIEHLPFWMLKTNLSSRNHVFCLSGLYASQNLCLIHLCLFKGLPSSCRQVLGKCIWDKCIIEDFILHNHGSRGKLSSS